jgi:hypothetical protein
LWNFIDFGQYHPSQIKIFIKKCVIPKILKAMKDKKTEKGERKCRAIPN